MGRNEQIERCMQIANFWSDRYSARMEIEWKVTLGLWALLAGAALFLSDKHFPDLAWLAVPIVAGHALWLRGIWVSNFDNKMPAYHWARQAEALMINPAYALTSPPTRVAGLRKVFGFLGDWSMIFQLGTTALLVLVASSLVGTKCGSPI